MKNLILGTLIACSVYALSATTFPAERGQVAAATLVALAIFAKIVCCFGMMTGKSIFGPLVVMVVWLVITGLDLWFLSYMTWNRLPAASQMDAQSVVGLKLMCASAIIAYVATYVPFISLLLSRRQAATT